MPEPLTSYIATWRGNYGYIYSDLYSLRNYLDDCAVQATAQNWSGLSNSLALCADAVYDVARHFRYGSPDLYRKMNIAMQWIDDNWPTEVEEYELDWKKICEAWVANDFEGKEWTIAVIDRMRTLMWDEPYYVRWAARPDSLR